MSISKEALRGYLLEEALAFLIKNTGYTLLVDEKQDPQEIKNSHHGIVVKGRGAEHQADVLGQLNWIPAFTFPIRLFVEAKFRKTKTGIGPVRNAVGILNDLNQNYHAQNNLLIKRHTYNYALFSTSGFSKDAEDMAFAHKVSLIDLRNPEIQDLLNSIDIAAELIIQKVLEDDNFSEGLELSLRRYISGKSMINLIRKFIRFELNTWPDGLNEDEYTYLNRLFKSYLSDMLDTIRNYGELFIGMANGPFLIVLKADSPEEFLSSTRESTTHEVQITWSRDIDNGRLWSIRPYNNKKLYRLSFVLPEKLGDWIFNSKDPVNYARNIKGEFFSDITIYRSTFRGDQLIRLKYKPQDIDRRS